MFNICRVQETAQGLVGKNVIAVAETQEEAEERILAELESFDHSGRNEENHYWWGRNEGSSAFRFYFEGNRHE